MLAFTGTCPECHGLPYFQPSEINTKSFLELLMYSWADRWRREYVERDGESPFQSYLEGYFNSFDFYPTCERKLYESNDAYALWLDFLRVALDVEAANEQLKTSPESFLLALKGAPRDEIESRKKEAEARIQRQAIGGGESTTK